MRPAAFRPVFARNIHLSATVPAVGMVALMGLWTLFGWLALSQQRDALSRVEGQLADIAAAYGEHAGAPLRPGL